MISKMHMIWLGACAVFAVMISGGCSSIPGAAGEPCNFSASPKCDATSHCVVDGDHADGLCHQLCSSSADCSSGECSQFTLEGGASFKACDSRSGGSSGAGPGSGPPVCAINPPMENIQADAVPDSGEFPGQSAYKCSGGGVPDCGLYCRTQDGVSCCASYGHPEFSCASGLYCTQDGRCADSPTCASPPLKLFHPCSTGADCADSASVLRCTDGQCVVLPGGRCINDSWCGSGASCHNGTCFDSGTCASDGDCGAGLTCSLQGLCAPASSGSGSGSCSSSCPSTCTGNVPEQACFYCQAACVCACAGDTKCATENRAAAASLGTTCP